MITGIDLFIKTEKEQYTKDTSNLGAGEIDLHTSSNNSFYGEPDISIKENTKIEIVEKFNRNEKRKRGKIVGSKNK